MLGEETVVLQGVADASDLLDEVVVSVVHQVESVGHLGVLGLVVVELYWAWVLVPVVLLPVVDLRLHPLEGQVSEVHVFAPDHEVGSLEASSGVGSQEAKDRDGSNSPSLSGLSDLLHRHGKSGQTCFDKHTSSEARGRSERTIKLRGVSTATLVSEVVSHWSEAALVQTLSLSSL